MEVRQVRPTGGRYKVVSSPIFWDVPTCNMHAVEDIGAVVDWLTELVAVLHNHNDMINLFRAM